MVTPFRSGVPPGVPFVVAPLNPRTVRADGVPAGTKKALVSSAILG